jgi:hypothetical protein
MGDTPRWYGFPYQMSWMWTSSNASEKAGRKEYKAGKETVDLME